MIKIPETVTLTDNKSDRQFEWRIGEHLAKLEYRVMENGIVALTHTEVDPELEGKGVAGKLVEAVIAQLQKENKQIRPYCSYVQAYVNRHPESKQCVDPGFKK